MAGHQVRLSEWGKLITLISRDGLKITEQSLGTTHPDYVTVLSNYASLLCKMHRKDEARRLEARVRMIRANADSGGPTTFQVDWRDLQKPNKAHD